MATRRLEVEILGDTRGLSRAFQSAERDAGRFGTAMSRAGSGVATIGRVGAIAATALGGLAVVGLGAAARAAIDAERSNARLNAQLTALGENTPEIRDHINEVVQAQSRMSGFDDEDLQDAFTNLVRLTGDVTQSLNLNNLAMDIARAKHIDVAAAATIVGRVAEGNTGILARYGIQVEHGSTAVEALGQLHQRFAGQAEAYGQTTAGSMERAQVSLENLGESVGASLAPAIATLADWAAVTLPRVGDQIGRFVDSVVGWFRDHWTQIRTIAQTVFEGMRSAWQNILQPALVAIQTAGAELVAAFERNWPRIRAAAEGVMEWYRDNLQPTIQAVVGAIRGFWDRFGDDIVNTTRTFLEQTMNVLRPALATVRSIIETALALLRGDWGAAWQGMKDTVRNALDTAEAVIRGAFTIWKTLAVTLARNVLEGLNDILSHVAGTVRQHLDDIPGEIAGLATAVAAAAASLGGRLIQAIVDAIVGAGGRIKDALQNAVSSAIPDIHIPTPHISIPHPFATGGIVTKPTIGLVGEAGPEAIIPLDRLGSMGRSVVVNQYFTVADGHSPNSLMAAASWSLKTAL